MHLSKYDLSFKYHPTPTSFRKPSLIASVHMGLSWIVLWVRPSARHWGHRIWVNGHVSTSLIFPGRQSCLLGQRLCLLCSLYLLPRLDLGHRCSPIWEMGGPCPQATGQGLRLGMLGQSPAEQLQEQPHRRAVSDPGPLRTGQGPYE